MATKIEWADATWNPITGCTPTSPGCDNCYAKRMTERNLWGYDFTPGTFHIERINQPVRWRKPRTIFVCSMSDLWHPDVLPTYRSVVFQTIALAPQHRYLFLTKRPERIDSFPNRANCGLGVTVENSDYLWRIEKLLKIPAAMRFVSIEPMLSEVDLHLATSCDRNCNEYIYAECPGTSGLCIMQRRLDWIIAGGETGPGARPMDPAWARLLRDQCQAAGVPFFFKQWGEWLPDDEQTLMECDAAAEYIDRGEMDSQACGPEYGGMEFYRVGKKTAGRLLDGREWSEFPEWGDE